MTATSGAPGGRDGVGAQVRPTAAAAHAPSPHAAAACEADRAAWRPIVDAAAEPYRAAGRFARGFARGKLSMDPVFAHLLRDGAFADGARVVDIGCGQGLLASVLRVAAAAARGAPHAPPWPPGWARPPQVAAWTGVELMARDVERGRAALGAGAAGPTVSFIHGDMRTTPLPACDVVVVLDVLHYVDVPAQDAVLARVRDALAGSPTGGRLLLRVGDAASRRGFAASQWVDRIVTRLRGHRAPPTWGRPLGEWTAALAALGFDVAPRPMSRGTPFANVLLVADLRARR